MLGTGSKDLGALQLAFRTGMFCLFKHRVGGINVKNRHAPEHKWPGPQEDIYDAVKWVRQPFTILAVAESL
jgi:hypothetical protein